MSMIVISVYIIIGYMEIKPLLDGKKKKDAILFIVFFVPAFIISLILSFGVELPKPEHLIQQVIEAIIGKTD